MPGGFIDCHFQLRVAGRVYHHALKYLPVWPWAETKRPEGRYVYQRTTHSAIRCGFLNNHTAGHGRM